MNADFFDSLYADADGDETAIPWQQAMSRRLIGEWIETLEPGRGRRALVVAAGLGDDAAALAELGFDVVAFDQAPNAVEWARRRHPDAAVDWHVADLFHTPTDWREAFDLVIEVFTIQSIPPELHAEAATATRAFLAPGGTLVAVAVVHDGSVNPSGPPWPLDASILEELGDGLTERSRHVEEVSPTVRCVRLELARDAA